MDLSSVLKGSHYYKFPLVIKRAEYLVHHLDTKTVTNYAKGKCFNESNQWH